MTCPENTESVRRIREAFGSVGVRPTIKITAFDLNAQDDFWSDPGTRVEIEPVCFSN